MVPPVVKVKGPKFPVVASTGKDPGATTTPAGFVTWMTALNPAPGDGLIFPVILIDAAPLAEVGLGVTVTVAAATDGTSGVRARNATSIPAAIVGSAFMWITEG